MRARLRSLSRRLSRLRAAALLAALALLALPIASLVLPLSAQAALTASAAVTGSFTSSAGATVAYDAGSGAGRVLVVLVATDDATHGASSITYGGQAMTQAVSAAFPLFATERMQLYYLANPTANGSNDLVMKVTAADNYSYVVTTVSGADTTSPIGTVGSAAYSQGNAPYAQIYPSKSGSLLIAGYATEGATVSAAYNGSTKIGEKSTTGVTGSLYSQTAGSGTNTIYENMSPSYTYFSSGAIEIKAGTLPTAQLAVSAPSAVEPSNTTGLGGFSGSIQLSRTGSTASALPISYTLGGTATYGSDYAIDASAGTCTSETMIGADIPAGLSSCLVSFKPIADSASESTETISAALDPDPAYAMGSGQGAVIYITDNTTPITQCSDGVDNDADGLADLQDPGCINAQDDDETDPLPQPETYSVDSPGFATMYLYDDDTPPMGALGDFSASPSRVKPGQTAVLVWNITGMTDCAIDHGIGPVDATDGTHSTTTPAIASLTTFMLTCTDGVTPVARAVSIGIVPSFIEQ